MIKRNYFISVEYSTNEKVIKWVYIHLTRVSLFGQSLEVLNDAVDEIKKSNNIKDVRVLAFNRC
jgi:hypothetical protein